MLVLSSHVCYCMASSVLALGLCFCHFPLFSFDFSLIFLYLFIYLFIDLEAVLEDSTSEEESNEESDNETMEAKV